MYEYIRGDIASLSPTQAVLDVSGVGYLINISLQTFTSLEGAGQAKLFIQMVIREDAHILYGFVSESERELFRLLISVSGIGAGTARVMLSAYGSSELAGYIALGNVASLKSIKGIGLKTAERVILDLKDKVLNIADSTQNNTSQSLETGSPMAQATEALMVLGYNRLVTQKAVKSVFATNPHATVEELIRGALQLI